MFFLIFQNMLVELEVKKPRLDELVNTADSLKTELNKEYLHNKGRCTLKFCNVIIWGNSSIVEHLNLMLSSYKMQIQGGHRTGKKRENREKDGNSQRPKKKREKPWYHYRENCRQSAKSTKSNKFQIIDFFNSVYQVKYQFLIVTIRPNLRLN